MSTEKTKSYEPKPRGWFDEPEPAPSTTPLDRETLKRKTMEAAVSVGHVAPSEVPQKPVSDPLSSVLADKATRAPKTKPVGIDIEPKGKGRPKGDRTVQMSVRIREDHDQLIKSIAGDDFTVASIVEAALVAFARTLIQDKKYKRMPLDEETLELAKRIAQ
jgi:hypothetical protein